MELTPPVTRGDIPLEEGDNATQACRKPPSLREVSAEADGGSRNGVNSPCHQR